MDGQTLLQVAADASSEPRPCEPGLPTTQVGTLDHASPGTADYTDPEPANHNTRAARPLRIQSRRSCRPGTPRPRRRLPIRQTGSARPRQSADSGSRGYDTYFPASFRLTGRTGRSPRRPPLGNPLDPLNPCKPGVVDFAGPGLATAPARNAHRQQGPRSRRSSRHSATTASTHRQPDRRDRRRVLLGRLPMWRPASGPARTPPRPTPDHGELQRPGPLPRSEEAVTSGDRPCQRAIARRFAIS